MLKALTHLCFGSTNIVEPKSKKTTCNLFASCFFLHYTINRMKKNLLLLQTGIFNINTWFIKVSPTEVIIVDPASCKESNDKMKIVNFLNQNNLQPIGIILTHCHFDHIAGTKVLKTQFPNCKIAVHKLDAEAAASKAKEMQGQILNSMGFGFFVSALENLPNPEITFSGNETLASFKTSESTAEVIEQLDNWKIIHTPGHTPGGICLYNKTEKQLISGDTLFYQTYGRTDLPGGNHSQMMKTLSFIKETIPSDTNVYPGHDHFDFTLDEC